MLVLIHFVIKFFSSSSFDNITQLQLFVFCLKAKRKGSTDMGKARCLGWRMYPMHMGWVSYSMWSHILVCHKYCKNLFHKVDMQRSFSIVVRPDGTMAPQNFEKYIKVLNIVLQFSLGLTQSYIKRLYLIKNYNVKKR